MNYLQNFNDEELIKKYKPLIYKVALKIKKDDYRLDVDDLVQVGYETILKLKKKNINIGNKSVLYIQKILTRQLREEQNLQRNIISIPRYITDYISHYYQAKRLYNTTDEIETYLKNKGMGNRTKVLMNMNYYADTVDVDEYEYNNALPTYMNMDTVIDNKRIITLIEYLLQFIRPIAQKAIRERYLDDNKQVIQIAKELNISKATCSAMIRASIKKLRRKLQSKLKEEFNYGIFETEF